MDPFLIGFLATLAALTVLMVISLIAKAVTDIRIAAHTGRDPRATHLATTGADATRQLLGAVDKVAGRGHSDGGPTN